MRREVVPRTIESSTSSTSLPSNSSRIGLSLRRTEFEGNYVQSRPRVTRGRSKWPLAWHIMEESDYQDLLAFFAANQGGSFDWTHPASAVEYACRFSEDQLTSKIASTGKRKDVKCPIEEV